MAKNQFLPPKVRRPREELQQAVGQLETCGFTVAGSWRREKPTVGDLDIIVPSHIDFGEAIRTVQTFFAYEEMRGGSLKSEGIARYKDEALLLNLWRVPEPHAWAGMLLYATGPHDLNIMMRANAQGRGWVLNQYGLFQPGAEGEDSKQIDNGEEESDIFHLLGLQALTPQEREVWREHLLHHEKKTGDIVQVPSSDGISFYAVEIENGVATHCECKGFEYRHKCRHLAEAEKAHARR